MNRQSPSCTQVKDELVALLYGELEAGERAGIEQHVERCAECRAELEGLARTRRALDAWSPLSSEPSEARDALDIALRRSRVARGKRSVLWGVAAAVLAFLGLSAVGAELDYRSGRVTVSFELPWIPRAELASSEARDWERMQSIARRAADEALVAWEAAQGERFADWSQREEEQRSQLVYAIERARDLDRESFANLLTSFQRGAAQEIQFTRAALGELSSLVAQRDQ